MSKSFIRLIIAIVTFASINIDVFAQPGRGGRGGFSGPVGERMEPEDMPLEYGVAEIADRAAFEKLSYQGPDVFIDGYLADLEFVKFFIENPWDENANVYFMNTENYRAHPPFMRMIGVSTRGAARGAITYLPRLKAPNGDVGLYIIDFEPNDSYSFEEVKTMRDALTEKMPILKDRVAFHPLRGNVARYENEKAKYAASDVAVHLDSDLYKNIVYLPLNAAESFGRLRVMEHNGRPSPRDVVIYQTLPNQMPRVAGVITEERQTPLSHVNLRAVQDKIPNAYIESALNRENVRSLLDKFVHYAVTPQGYTLREATKDEVDEHFRSLRPDKPQVAVRDLTITKIRPLSELTFEDSKSVGVKAANLATMHTFEFPEGTVPQGFAVPFYFYDEFMKHNGFYEHATKMLKSPEFQQDPEVQVSALKEFRSLIKKAEMPPALMGALGELQKSFPEDASMRCRSSTNNEDLPGFSGAGLYDSYTHKPDEGHLSKSIKQVFASLWNFRAFEEREFYRIDHLAAAMGVLVHPNYKGELANGVAVTDDILYETYGNYYLNTQVGENLVTNPEEQSIPEETLLSWFEREGHEVMRKSNRSPDGKEILSADHLQQLRAHLARIHARFARLYGHSKDDENFAMEIEFKITKDGRLAIKQARPWVY